jgi:hypothetical protein
MKRYNVLIRFKADTGEFLSVISVSTDRSAMWELKRKYNKDYPDFRYEVFDAGMASINDKIEEK